MKPAFALSLLQVITLIAALPLPALDRDLPEPALRTRTEIRIPDPPGFVTLKCDFHMHSVFSDGLVWPTVRPEEAWREGLDAIALTDHVEYQAHKPDVSTNLNRSYEIARGTGADLDILVIRASEITRPMPPGHLNAIFLTNCAALSVSNWTDAVAAAHAQGAFLFWNHPGWERQATNGLAVWYPEHTQLVESGMLHGIEVVNGRSYYPEAHAWAIEKKLAMIANSDIHGPIYMDYDLRGTDRRPVTLVFARERTIDAIKEALFARRTAVFAAGHLIGDECFLRPIFQQSIRLKNPQITLRPKGRALIQIANDSSIEYRLERTGELTELQFPKELVLPARKTAILDVKSTGATALSGKSFTLPYAVANLLTGPDQPLAVGIEVQIR